MKITKRQLRRIIEQSENAAREIMTSQVDPGHVNLHIRGRRINVELATTNETRNRGLMHRYSLDPNAGMLFVFPDSNYRSFWMENTHIPLSIAYLTEAGQIINIERMQPLNRAPIKSAAPAKYALEVNEGWFKKNEIQAGDHVTGLSDFLEIAIRENPSPHERRTKIAEARCYIRQVLLEESRVSERILY